MTQTQKILSAVAGRPLKAGELVSLPLDLIMANDITGILSIKLLEKYGLKPAFPGKTVFVLDHFTPNKDIKSAENCRIIRDFCKKYGIRCLEEGCGGIEHALLPEQGYVTAGDVIIGADSHTCTYGALGAFSTGVGSTDFAAAASSGECWFRVPDAIGIKLTDKLSDFTSGKDLILSLIGKIGVDGASYMSLEFFGDGVSSLSIDDRFTVCNMAIEAGAKNGIFPVDSQTKRFLDNCGAAAPREFISDGDYSHTVTVDLSSLVPTVACPNLPSNVRPARELASVKIDQAVIGSCTNGRLSDLEKAAALLRGRRIADGVRTIVIPATQKIYRQALENGTLAVFADAGCIISAPSCGPCLGGHLGVLADGEIAVATTNRNFTGRMGHTGSGVYLASPEVAAASAVTGHITDPSEVL